MSSRPFLACFLVAYGLVTGCAGAPSSARVSYRPTNAAYVLGSQPGGEVEVLLDDRPARPFIVTGELSTRTGSNPVSIEAMRKRAADDGLDGIYWIECASPCGGRCTARGFVYEGRAEPLDVR